MNSLAVQVSGLHKSIGPRVILDGISSQVRPGDVIGVIGKNGAGKTTLLEALLGLSPPTAGSASIFGENSLHMSAGTKARIGFVPQQDELIPMLTGQRQIELTAAFYSHWDGALLKRLAENWEVPLDRRIAVLSGGERQKLSTLLALGNSPDLLVLDEPVSSLDPLARRQFLQQLLEIASDERRAVIFSSHIVSDLERVANRIWILKDGRLLWDGDTDELKNSITRLHIRATRELPATIQLPGVLILRRATDGRTATATVRDLSHESLPVLEQQLQAQIEVEALGLEDIFLELHS